MDLLEKFNGVVSAHKYLRELAERDYPFLVLAEGPDAYSINGPLSMFRDALTPVAESLPYVAPVLLPEQFRKNFSFGCSKTGDKASDYSYFYFKDREIAEKALEALRNRRYQATLLLLQKQDQPVAAILEPAPAP